MGTDYRTHFTSIIVVIATVMLMMTCCKLDTRPH